MLKIVKEQQIPNVLMVAYWKRLEPRAVDFGAAMLKTVRELRKVGTRVWVVMDVPIHDFMIPRALAFHVAAPQLFPDPLTRATTASDHFKSNAMMVNYVAELRRAGAEIIDPAPLLANKEGRYIVQDGAASLYADVGHHLSTAGALKLKPAFKPIFQGLPAKPF